MFGTYKAEKVRTNVYVGRLTKEKAQRVLKRYGLSLSEAVNLFLAVIAETGTLPFEFRIPNQTTQRVMKEILAKENVEEISIEDLVREVKKT